MPINHPGISIRFRLTEGSSQIWRETQPSVKIVDGVFNVMLGSVIPLDTVRFDRPLLLKIKVGTDPEISPHTPLAAAAYAKALPGLYTYYHDDGNSQSHNVVGGAANNAVGTGVTAATIGGGGGIHFGIPKPNNVLGDFGTVGGGNSNTASGINATVPGGSGNRASGTNSFAAGRTAVANHDGTFVWNDGSTIFDSLASTGPNQFLIRAAGGVGIGTNAPSNDLTVNGDADFTGRVGILTNAPASPLHVGGEVTIDRQGAGVVLLNLKTERNWVFRQSGSGGGTALHLASVGGGGNKNFVINTLGDVGIGETNPVHPLHMLSGAHVTAGGIWTDSSSRTMKQDFESVDPSSVLDRVMDLDVMRWRYKAELESVHMGPVAEDFYGAFGLGADNQHIASLDGNGVALAAIQGLYQLVQDQQKTIEELSARLRALE